MPLMTQPLLNSGTSPNSTNSMTRWGIHGLADKLEAGKLPTGFGKILLKSLAFDCAINETMT